MSRRYPSFELVGAALMAVSLSTAGASAAVIIDNGVVDPTRTTWNDTDPSFTIFDDFMLGGADTITGINHSIFMQNTGTTYRPSSRSTMGSA